MFNGQVRDENRNKQLGLVSSKLSTVDEKKKDVLETKSLLRSPRYW